MISRKHDKFVLYIYFMDNPPGNWEKIKNSLLKSGIPLEVSTCKKLVEYGYHDFGEYFYERNEKIFSLDMHGTKFIDTPISSKQGCIELLIECKYREPNKAWYFFSFKGDIFGLKRENPTNIFIDLPLKEIILNNNKKRKRTPEEYISHTVKEFILYPKREKEFIPISGKGIEEIETKTDKKTQKKSQNTSFEEDMDVSNNPYSLKHGIYQLRFGSASFVSRTFETYADGFFEDHLFTAVFPIL
jgi:hypothetical protein